MRSSQQPSVERTITDMVNFIYSYSEASKGRHKVSSAWNPSDSSNGDRYRVTSGRQRTTVDVFECLQLSQRFILIVKRTDRPGDKPAAPVCGRERYKVAEGAETRAHLRPAAGPGGPADGRKNGEIMRR
ncbi:hypothetical protein EVAR_6320_1 [Eumeta japonica]|uniref:Uncharacterized protein n=1 Tax=Eumeta variegata TaxID=151549 RepID=A0A4C1T8C8_EUMVA|nr:hypothetical protein EVAR_6320_1 [Eumeta japonica]